MAKLLMHRKPKVLVVDGDRDFLELFDSLFYRWFLLTPVDCYIVALEKLQRGVFDVAVADLASHSTPPGQEFLQGTRDHREGIPVLFTANITSTSRVNLCRRAGGIRLLEKNFSCREKVIKTAGYIMDASLENPADES